MDNKFERFIRKIGIKDISPYEKGYFTSLKNDKENNRIICCIYFDTYLLYKDYETLFDTIDSFTSKGGFDIRISFKYGDERSEFPRLLEEFKSAKKCRYLNDVQLSESELTVNFMYKEAGEASLILPETTRLREFLDSISSNYRITTQEKVYFDSSFSQRKEDQYQKAANEAIEKAEELERINSTYQPSRLKDIENYRMVTVEGTIFKVDERTSKKGTLIRTIEFTDYSDSVSCPLYERKFSSKEEMYKYDVGVKIRMNARVNRQTFGSRNEVVLDMDTIEAIESDPVREDTSEEKRVELHLHTNISAFDGIPEIKQYTKLAKHFGHKAIAVTDHGVCQALPDAQEAGEKDHIKILNGCEFYVVDDNLKYIYNPSDRLLKKETYVVFDLETTGLSARYDRIIEFGAVKIDAQGNILDEVDFFINPDMKLSGFAVEVSHIRQSDVDNGKPIKKALQDIKEFFGDSILVAHNAAFDYGFLNEAMKNNGFGKITNPVIDTLPISRYLYKDRKSHTEGAIARELKIEYLEGSAHRANYDAEILSKIFEVMLSTLATDNPGIKHKDLADLPVDAAMIKGMHPYHVCALVKNNEGLRDLYKIISESHLNYMSSNGTPIVPKSYLASMRSNLLLGSACLNGQVFEYAMTKSEGDLKNEMMFYDYIEVQPPENYIYLIHNGTLRNEDSVKSIIKDIIKAAGEVGKPVCATGDCHYLNPQDKIYRDVYISSKQLHGARHPLNLAPYDNASDIKKKKWYDNPLPNPDQHFRSTDEMLQCFSFLEDEDLIKQIVITNTNMIADMIDDDVKPTKKGLYPPKIENCDQMLTNLVYDTAHEMYGDPLPEPIQQRLDEELKGIIDNGYAVIYWISSQLVTWSNDQGYMVGSRGSVGSSLVATMAKITEVNPLPPHYRCPKCKHIEWADVTTYASGIDLPDKCCPHCGEKMIGDGQNIPFATFLGFHAEKTPDIDLNFPSEFQAIAHQHLKDLLGEDNVYKAGTIQDSQEKNARGYVLGYFESIGKDTSKIRNAEIDRIASGCIGVKKTTGQHPGGVIVIPDYMDVYDFTPIQYPANETDASWKTTHYSFKKIHDNVLKFDMLGHQDPQAIKMMCDYSGMSFQDIKEKVPLNDRKALSLFWSTDALELEHNYLNQETGALGLPEFGTELARRTLLETKPRSFDDLVKISGLSHGTNVYGGNARDLILDDNLTLKDVICCRDDIMTKLHDIYGMDYSDTFALMEIVRKGNFSKPSFADKREKYTKLMREHNVPEYLIASCEKIAYLFPRAHAVAYVTMAVRCAWFKVYRPLPYYATYFTLRCDAYDIEAMTKGLTACQERLADIRRRQATFQPVSDKEKHLIDTYEAVIEMYDRGYKMGHLSISRSEASKFVIDEKNKTIIPPFSTIDGFGESAASPIIEARNRGMFTSVEDLQQRGRVSDKTVGILRSLDALEDLPESEQLTLF